MAIDLALLWSIAEKVILAGAGALVGRFFERRPRVVVFYGHIGLFRLEANEPGGAMGTVHTHSVVIRNIGKLPANNVRLPHTIQLRVANVHVSVNPDTPFTRELLPGGTEEIRFATLVPGQQVTVAYLYFPPLIWNQINLPLSSDAGMARVLNVLPTPQLPRWLLLALWSLIGVGVIALLYLLIELSRKLGVWPF